MQMLSFLAVSKFYWYNNNNGRRIVMKNWVIEFLSQWKLIVYNQFKSGQALFILCSMLIWFVYYLFLIQLGLRLVISHMVSYFTCLRRTNRVDDIFLVDGAADEDCKESEELSSRYFLFYFIMKYMKRHSFKVFRKISQ